MEYKIPNLNSISSNPNESVSIQKTFFNFKAVIGLDGPAWTTYDCSSFYDGTKYNCNDGQNKDLI